MIYYMASERPLKIIEKNKDKPYFFTEAYDLEYRNKIELVEKEGCKWKSAKEMKKRWLDEFDESINMFSKLFTGKHYYFVGANLEDMCGCDFPYAMTKDVKDIPDFKSKFKGGYNVSMEALLNYLNEISKTVSMVEIYARWAGDHGLKSVISTEYNLSEIDAERFVFVEGEFLKINLDK